MNTSTSFLFRIFARPETDDSLGLSARLAGIAATVLLICASPDTASAQNFLGISVGRESFPLTRMQKPISGAEDLEIRTTSWYVGAAFPLEFADGKILMLNRLSYKRLGFSYRNTSGLPATLTQAQSIQLSFFVIDSLTERWSMIASMTPGLASDFDRSVTMDDFTLQAILGFVRKYGEDFQLGFGLAYSRDFGPPIPLPFLYVDWKIAPDLTFNGIVPVNFDFRYRLHRMIDLGLAVKVRGDRYHGDPRKYGVNNPQLEYSEATVSPSAQVHLSQWIHLNIESGITFYRNFEFLDGDISAASYDMKPTGYLRTEILLGM